jgi:hypothetical protein
VPDNYKGLEGLPARRPAGLASRTMRLHDGSRTLIKARSFAGVTGRASIFTPSGRSASSIAAQIAGGSPSAPVTSEMIRKMMAYFSMTGTSGTSPIHQRTTARLVPGCDECCQSGQCMRPVAVPAPA